MRCTVGAESYYPSWAHESMGALRTGWVRGRPSPEAVVCPGQAITDNGRERKMFFEGLALL